MAVPAPSALLVVLSVRQVDCYFYVFNNYRFIKKSVKFYIFTIMAFVYVYVSGLHLVQLPTICHREHLIASILM